MPTPEELNKTAIEAYKAGKYAEAITSCEEAIGQKPDYVPCYINLTLAYIKKGKQDDALRTAVRAAELAPNNASVRNNLGNAQNAKGRWNEAVTEYLRAWEIDKAQFNALFNAAALLMDNAVDAKALETLKTYLEKAPADHPKRKEAEERLRLLDGGSSLIKRF